MHQRAEPFFANPIRQIWSGALMLDHLGYKDAGDAIVNAIETETRDDSFPSAIR
ncbi:MAG: hypothetical protein WED11_06710 [Natronospirillum sp.]